jgi:hypothetical protein
LSLFEQKHCLSKYFCAMNCNFLHALCLNFFPFLFFQPDYDGETLKLDRSSPAANISYSGVPSSSHSPCHCAEHLSRITDLEGRLSLLKRQAKTTVD